MLTAGVVGVAACGSDSEGSGGSGSQPGAMRAGAYGAQVASYDLAAERPQRFLVGLIGTDGGLLVGGDVRLDFTYFGEGTASSAPADEEPSIEGVVAAFVPVAGGLAPPAGEGPRLRAGDEGVGVYEATDVAFNEPGFWGVTVHANVDGEDVALEAAFEVLPQHQIVNAGVPAPRTVNLLPGTTEAEPAAVDSRADADGSVPDPELHPLTVADAIANGKPTLVVVSTPTFCVSRFCGPISVQALAQQFGERANFVHIEVWKDFEGNVMNRGAAEWIYPSEDVEPFEPWVFLVDDTGTVAQRWDNVANEAALGSALEALLS